MPTQRSHIQEDTHYRILRLLEANPDLTQREIASELGLSTGGMNYCLRALIDKGWINVQNFSESKNKFGYIYVLTPVGIAQKIALAGKFLQRKKREYESLRIEIDQLSSEIEAEPLAQSIVRVNYD